jgi:hypothetical protein
MSADAEIGETQKTPSFGRRQFFAAAGFSPIRYFSFPCNPELIVFHDRAMLFHRGTPFSAEARSTNNPLRLSETSPCT